MTITATTSGANGVGGIFGANNNNDMKIEECMFTGIVRSGNDVGGIAGVGVNVLNCLVENASVSNTVSGSNGNAAGICGTNKSMLPTVLCVIPIYPELLERVRLLPELMEIIRTMELPKVVW